MIGTIKTASRLALAIVVVTNLWGCVANMPRGNAAMALNPVYEMPSDPALVADINNARPMVNGMLQTIACERNLYNNSRLVRFSTPDSPMNWFVNPRIGMSYHKTGCLNVTSVEGWQRLAKNAIRFSAKFISPESGEGAISHFKLYKQTDGRWLAYL